MASNEAFRLYLWLSKESDGDLHSLSESLAGQPFPSHAQGRAISVRASEENKALCPALPAASENTFRAYKAKIKVQIPFIVLAYTKLMHCLVQTYRMFNYDMCLTYSATSIAIYLVCALYISG